MGIYTSNRYFGEAYDYASEIPMNEAYDAAFGCAHILADCQRNDMAIFESSILGDIAEVRSIQEGYGYVNENAFTDLIKKIIETFKKLIAKIKGIFAAFIAKITGAFKDGKDLVKQYEKQIIKYSNWKGFKCKKIRVPKSTNVNIKSAVNTLFKYDATGTGIQVNYSFTLGVGSGLITFAPIHGHKEYDNSKGVKAIDDADAEDLKNAIVENYLTGGICKDLTELHENVMDALFDDEDDIDDDNVKSGSYFSAAWIKQVLNEGEKWTKDIKKFNDNTEKNINIIIDNLNKDDDALAKYMSKNPDVKKIKAQTGQWANDTDYADSASTKRVSRRSGMDFEKTITADATTKSGNQHTATTEDLQKAIHALQKIAGNDQEVIAKVTSEYMEVNKFVLAQARKLWTAAAAWSSGVHKESVEYANAMGDVAAEQLYTVMESVGY